MSDRVVLEGGFADCRPTRGVLTETDGQSFKVEFDKGSDFTPSVSRVVRAHV